MRVIPAVLLCMITSACSTGDADLPKLLTTTPDSVRITGGDYSPDGSRVAYWSPAKETLGWDLWVANADFSSPMRLPVKSPFYGRYGIIWSRDGKQIATTSGQYGTADVVVVPSAGGEPRRLTSGSGFEGPFQWHPTNPDLIAYWSTVEGGNIQTWVVSLSTGKHRPLLPAEKRPYVGWWSPDGSRIAYSVSEGDRTTIWIADSAGESRRQLTSEGFEEPSGSAEGPWSADGKELLYESRRTGTADLWVIAVDGGKRRQLTRDIRNDRAPAWSSDGKWIAFLSDRGKQSDVWVIPAAGGTERRITDTETEEIRVRWKPHAHELEIGTRMEKTALWSVSVADLAERQLTPDSLGLTFFNLSPDGTKLAYVVDRGGGVHDLVVAPFAGGPPRTLIAGGGDVLQPRWSPDGSNIVFRSDRGGSPDVWSIKAAGGEPRQLVGWPGWEEDAYWSGDGSSVYFRSDRESRLGDVWRVSPDGGEATRVTTVQNISAVRTRRGVKDLMVEFIGGRGGAFGVGRLTPEGRITPLWDSTNAFAGAIAPAGNEVTVLVERAGQRQSVILPFAGGPGRTVLSPNEFSGAWSNDGKRMLYRTESSGANDFWLYDFGDGSRRRLTTTPESETGAEWTPDDRTVLFRRVRTVEQISILDIARTLAPTEK